MLTSLGTQEEVISIVRFNTDTQQFETCDFEGQQSFPIIGGGGYILWMKKEKEVVFSGEASPLPINLTAGFNLIGQPATAKDLTTFHFLKALGEDKVSSIHRFNTSTGVIAVNK